MSVKPDGGASDNYASIDPVALKGATDSLQKSVDGVHNNIPGLVSDFGYFGIDTSRLTTLTTIAKTLNDLIPQLRRRQSMAEQLVAEHPENGKVAYFQGDLLGQFNSVSAAQAQAHIDAQKVKDAASHGHGVPDDVYNDLRKYGDDPDYAAAFVNDLGTKFTAYMLLDAENRESGGRPDEAKLTALGTTFGTASYRVKFDDSYLSSLDQSLGDLGLGINPLKVFAPMMRYGTWSQQALENIADSALTIPAYEGGPIGDLDSLTVDDIFRGLANNPIAAADYYSKHRQALFDLGNDKLPVQPTMAYTDFLHAATIDARNMYALWELNGGAPNGNLAEKNANWLVNEIGKDGGDGHGLLDKTYADIGAEYFDDFVAGLMSPVDVSTLQAKDGGSGAPWLAVNASEDTWKKLFALGMRSDEGLIELTGVFQSKATELSDQLRSQTNLGQQAGTNTTPYLDPQKATAWLAYARFELQTDFKASLDSASSAIDKDWHDRLDSMTSLVSKGLDWISDPKGIPADLESMATGAAKDWLAGTIGSLLLGKEPVLPNQKVTIDGTALDSQENYANDAIGQYNDGLATRPEHPFEGSYNDGEVRWDGNPSLYNDPKHPFVNPDGSVKPLSEIQHDPLALQGFIQWLQDPNVQSHVARTAGRPE